MIDVDGEACGSIGLRLGTDIERVGAEIGYWLGRVYWGRGIATSAVVALCSYAFDDLKLRRVFATPMTWNPASFRVLEKAGFECEGIMRNASFKDGSLADMAVREESLMSSSGGNYWEISELLGNSRNGD